MAELIPMQNKRFGRWTVEFRDPSNSPGCQNAKWICRCECGNHKSVVGSSLRAGRSLSCGCLQIETVRKASTKHGLSSIPAYRALAKAKSRCRNENNPIYRDYGGRGIEFKFDSVADGAAWIELNLGPRPKGCSLDRIDNNKGYEPGNLRWATHKDQVNNRRSFRSIESYSNDEMIHEIIRRGLSKDISSENLRTLPGAAMQRWNWGDENA